MTDSALIDPNTSNPALSFLGTAPNGLDFRPDNIFPARQHTLRLNTAEYAQGLYLCTFTGNGEEQTQRLVIE